MMSQYIKYIALKLDNQSKRKLLDLVKRDFGSSYNNVFCNHATLAYGPEEVNAFNKEDFGKRIQLEAYTILNDEHAVVLPIDKSQLAGIQSNNEFPHITLATSGMTKASYSNQLLNQYFNTSFDSISTTSLDQPIVLTAVVEPIFASMNQKPKVESAKRLVHEAKCKVKVFFAEEGIASSDVEEIDEREFKATIGSCEIVADPQTFSKKEIDKLWFNPNAESITIQTCKTNRTSDSGIALISEKESSNVKFFKSTRITLNQLITLLLRTSQQFFDVLFCQNLFGNRKTIVAEAQSPYDQIDLNRDFSVFISAGEKYNGGKLVRDIQKMGYRRGQMAKIDGYHFFVQHADRAEKVMAKIQSEGFDLGNIVGYSHSDANAVEGSRFEGIAVFTDKNYYIIYSDKLTDIYLNPLGDTYKISDMFVLSVCQVVNKYFRIQQFENGYTAGKIPRKLIELAIEDEKTGIGLS